MAATDPLRAFLAKFVDQIISRDDLAVLVGEATDRQLQVVFETTRDILVGFDLELLGQLLNIVPGLVGLVLVVSRLLLEL